MRSPWIAGIAVLPAMLFVTGCEQSFDSGDVQKQVAKSIEPTLGKVTVKCPGDISASKGTKVTCTATGAGGKQTKLVITVVDDDHNVTIKPAE